MDNKIAILIPCYNEEKTIGKVIMDFEKELPEAQIYVYNNNSTDLSVDIVKEHKNVILRNEYNQGKGNVIRRMFREVDADVYVLVDGDDTYPATQVHDLIKPILEGKAEMTVGDRISNGRYRKINKRKFHSFGNNIVKKSINLLFKSNLKDIMSGYRAFSKMFVKNIPILRSGFEVETEMTLFALDKKFIIKEIPVNYRERPNGSVSKLNTTKDGIAVCKTILKMYKDYQPRRFFKVISCILLFLGLFVGLPVIAEFIKTNYITKIPSAVLATGLILMAVMSFQCALILDTIKVHYKEQFELNLLKLKK